MTWLETAQSKGATIILHLDETSGTTAADASGNGHPFGYTGSVGLGRPPLVVDGGFSVHRTVFDQNPLAYIETGIPAGLAGASGDHVVQEAWVNIPAANVHGYWTKIGGASNGLGVGIGNYDNATDGHQLIMGASGLSWLETGITLSEGVHHIVVAATVTTMWAIRVYVDGVLAHTRNNSVNTASGKIAVGGTFWPDALAYLSADVDVDAVAFYAVDLTDADVAELYVAGTQVAAPPIPTSNAPAYVTDGSDWYQIGPAVPSGGTTGQVLKKLSDADYDVGWVTP